MALDITSYAIGKKAGGSGGGTITSVKMNGTTIATSGEADLGTVITQHQDISGKQDTLVSGTNIKTINNTSLLGSGNIDISTSNVYFISDLTNPSSDDKTILDNICTLSSDELKKVIIINGNDSTSLKNQTFFRVKWYLSTSQELVLNSINVQSYTLNDGSKTELDNMVYTITYDKTTHTMPQPWFNSARNNVGKYLDTNTNYSTPYTPQYNGSPATKKYVDDSVSTSAVQYSTIPTANSSLVGKIIQYTGTTTNDYTNGYFYECVDNSGVYSWENINVQASSGGGESDFHFIDLTSEGGTVVFNGMKKGVYFFKPVTSNIVGKFSKNNSGYKNLSISDGETNGMLFNAIIVTKDVDENLGNYQIFAHYLGVNNSASGQSVFKYVDVVKDSNNSSGIDLYFTGFGEYTSAQVKANKVNTIDANCDNQQYPSAKAVWDLPTTYSGYDASKTQVLKNVNGTLTWVDE